MESNSHLSYKLGATTTSSGLHLFTFVYMAKAGIYMFVFTKGLLSDPFSFVYSPSALAASSVQSWLTHIVWVF